MQDCSKALLVDFYLRWKGELLSIVYYMSSLEKCLFRSSENFFDSVQFKSVAQSCLTLCDLMDYSMPGLPVQHLLPEFTQTHVH